MEQNDPLQDSSLGSDLENMETTRVLRKSKLLGDLGFVLDDVEPISLMEKWSPGESSAAESPAETLAAESSETLAKKTDKTSISNKAILNNSSQDLTDSSLQTPVKKTQRTIYSTSTRKENGETFMGTTTGSLNSNAIALTSIGKHHSRPKRWAETSFTRKRKLRMQQKSKWNNVQRVECNDAQDGMSRMLQKANRIAADKRKHQVGRCR